MQNAHKGHFCNTFIDLHMYKFQKVQKRKTCVSFFFHFGNFQNRPKSSKIVQNRLAGLKIDLLDWIFICWTEFSFAGLKSSCWTGFWIQNDLRGPKSLERSKIGFERSENWSERSKNRFERSKNDSKMGIFWNSTNKCTQL